MLIDVDDEIHGDGEDARDDEQGADRGQENDHTVEYACDLAANDPARVVLRDVPGQVKGPSCGDLDEVFETRVDPSRRQVLEDRDLMLFA